MNLSEFITDSNRRDKLAAACGTTADWLYQVATGWNGKRVSTDLAQAIERESAKIGPEAVLKETLRPDVWAPAPKRKRKRAA